MFLTDSELIELLEADEIITDLELGDGEARLDRNAPVQPCSVDLRIGDVLVPGRSAGERGSPTNPSDGVILEAGQTAVVTTLEECRLPSNIGAIGFPPNTVSSEGILMTNPGHVDPGYQGRLRFTVINMGRQGYELFQGKKIVTLLFFKLDSHVCRDLHQRGGGDGSVESLLGVLSPDFLNITARVKAAARAEEEETNRSHLRSQFKLAIVGIIATIVALIGTSMVYTISEISDLKAKVNSADQASELVRKVQVERQIRIQSNGKSKSPAGSAKTKGPRSR